MDVGRPAMFRMMLCSRGCIPIYSLQVNFMDLWVVLEDLGVLSCEARRGSYYYLHCLERQIGLTKIITWFMQKNKKVRVPEKKKVARKSVLLRNQTVVGHKRNKSRIKELWQLIPEDFEKSYGGDKLHIGAIVSSLRIVKGIPFEELCKWLKLEPYELRAVETKAAWPGAMLAKYAVAFDMSVAQLITQKPYPSTLGTIKDPIGKRREVVRKLLLITVPIPLNMRGIYRQKLLAEESKATLPLETVSEFCRALNFPIDELIGSKPLTLIGTALEPAGDRIRGLRKIEGINAKVFAKIMGWNTATLLRAENAVSLHESIYNKAIDTIELFRYTHPGFKPDLTQWIFPPKGFIGLKIRCMRKSTKMTVKEISKLTGYSEGTILGMETSDFLKLGVLRRFAKAFHTTVDDILNAPHDKTVTLYGSPNAPIRKHFAAFRNSMGVSPRQMAKIAGMKPLQYINMEMNMKQCSYKVVIKMAEANRVTLSKLLHFNAPKISRHR